MREQEIEREGERETLIHTQGAPNYRKGEGIKIDVSPGITPSMVKEE